MKNFFCGFIGLVLMVAGVTLFILVVPTVEGTDLGFREYLWAMVIICSTCMGFGLIMISFFGEENLNAGS